MVRVPRAVRPGGVDERVVHALLEVTDQLLPELVERRDESLVERLQPSSNQGGLEFGFVT